MPHLPDHRNHDQLLIAALTAGAAEGADLEQARDLVATCDDCAELHHDLRAISVALPATSAPARPRDFTLTPEQAASLRPAGWRRLLAPLAGPRFAFAAPLGGSLAALGIAGILVAGAASTPVANVTGEQMRDRVLAGPASPDVTRVELDNAAPDASAGAAALPAPEAQPSEAIPVYGLGSSNSGDPAAPGAGVVGSTSNGGKTTGGGTTEIATGGPTIVDQPTSAEVGAGAPWSRTSPFAGLAVVLLVTGSVLLAGRWLARRVA